MGTGLTVLNDEEVHKEVEKLLQITLLNDSQNDLPQQTMILTTGTHRETEAHREEVICPSQESSQAQSPSVPGPAPRIYLEGHAVPFPVSSFLTPGPGHPMGSLVPN